MENTLPDDIEQLKRLLAEQEALNRALQAKLDEREREIDRLLSQLHKLRRMNFGSQSEKISRRITGQKRYPSSDALGQLQRCATG
ncbi:transposase [Serratia marcescens]|uniref:transposase n=1 Tax=Serratia marcescens TaxID=615 RepID=UPI0002B85240|nr:transposase [Serratia marcescens]EMF07330.1 IS66 transposase protein [Serratia marcescens VGH107]